MHGRIMEELSDLSIMENFSHAILIPIPLAPRRQRERGFNQAELICRKLINLDKPARNEFRSGGEKKLKLEKDVLIKPKDTEHQARIENRSARLKNIVGSFSVKNPEKIKNRNIIIIDDVTTTGATLNEARRVLKQAGARKIIAFTVAH
jgi:ComF family protein